MISRLLRTFLLLAGGLGSNSSALAQGGPPRDSMIDGERCPDGYTPMEIKNDVYPRTYTPNTERLGPKEMRVTAQGTGKLDAVGETNLLVFQLGGIPCI